MTQLDEQKARKRNELQQASTEPTRLRNGAQMLEAVEKDLTEQSENIMIEIQEHEKILEKLANQRRVANAEREELGEKVETIRINIAKRKASLDELERSNDVEEQNREMCYEKQRSLEAARFEQQGQTRNLHLSITEYQKNIDAQRRTWETIRRKKDTIMNVQGSIDEQVELAQYQLTEMETQYKQQRKVLEEIKTNKTLFISQFLAQEKLEEDTIGLVKAVQKDCAEYEEKIHLLQKEESTLQQQISSAATQRELIYREASKATAAYRDIKEELKVKKLILIDLDKQTKESFNHLKDCKLRFEKVKNQRNKLANLTQSSSQALAEMREKIKILHNEVDILRNESMAKDESLAEELRLHSSAQNARDALRVEQNKFTSDLKLKKEEEAQQMLEIIKLNSIVNSAEQQMMNMRRDYAQAVDNRNLTGIQLIDRNDELCILYEKRNIQSEIINHGDAELRQREDDIRRLEIEINEVQRRIEVARKQIPSLGVYAELTSKLKSLESQYEETKRATNVLCERLESPDGFENIIEAQLAAKPTSTIVSNSTDEKQQTHHTRTRILTGADPEPEQLAAKIDALENRLNDKKEQLLEKELMLEEVTSLGAKLRMQAAESRSSTLILANEVSRLQSKLRNVGRKMMATVSELSMYQATAVKLEQDRAERQQQAIEARSRLERGEAPSDAVESEWYRMERANIRAQEALVHGQTLRQEPPLAPISHAEPRPNAYLPDDLAIPRPYGGHAPFKPSVSGAQMRHFRQPISIPVVL